LHGLATGRFGVSPGETPEQNETRFQLLIAQLERERPDVVFLQEVNPLPQRAERYVTALAMLGLRYRVVHQVDACGVRFSGEKALFPELNNGLAILAREELELKKLMGLQLSGDLGKCQSTSGFQLGELRYGLIAEIGLPGGKERYLLASTHLHSGFETGGQFMKLLVTLYREGRFRQYPFFRWEVDQSRLRRIGELNVLIRMLSKLKREHGYASIMIAGDLNFEQDFPEYEEIRLLRFTDTAVSGINGRELYTADPVHNGWIRPEEGAPIPQSLLDAIAPEAPAVQDQIIAAYRDEMRRPRRIDYILIDTAIPHYCLKQTLFGLEADDRGFPASDHYGLLNTYSRIDPGQDCPGP
jgi:endonuclease/exonuclease/phosphatase family metal-dependent hydrolase